MFFKLINLCVIPGCAPPALMKSLLQVVFMILNLIRFRYRFHFLILSRFHFLSRFRYRLDPNHLLLNRSHLLIRYQILLSSLRSGVAAAVRS
jgi:uncharacterized membrane protein YfhO